MLNKSLIDASFNIDSIEKCVRSILNALSLISKTDLTILILQKGSDTVLYTCFNQKVRKYNYDDFLKFCFPNHLKNFKSVNINNLQEFFINEYDREEFKKLDLSNKKISSYYFSGIKNNDNQTIGTIHLGNFINNFFTNKNVRDKLDDFFIKIGKIIGKAMSFNEIIDHKNALRQVFSKFIPEQIIDKMLKEDNTREKGERREICILFSDIRSFTTISEKNSAENVVSFLNNYFNLMVRCIKEEGGIIDKFIGDAIVAIFGAPEYIENIAQKAVQAAVKMIKHLPETNTDKLCLPDAGFSIGIGIHIGKSIVGNVGSDDKMAYTSVGDVVSIAEELEGKTKKYGVQILFSDDVFKHLTDKSNCKKIDTLIINEKKVTIYTPVLL